MQCVLRHEVQGMTLGKAILYFRRALVLRCPTCGSQPIFPPLRRTRSMRDWFTPLDGCPRCGYPYEREPGYFLLAIWAVNYGCGSLLGLSIYLFLLFFTEWETVPILIGVLLPVAVFNLLFARHAKALFLAFDHFFDPHQKEGPDGDGNRPVRSSNGGRPPAPASGQTLDPSPPSPPKKKKETALSR